MLESKYLDIQRGLQGAKGRPPPRSVFASHTTFDSEAAVRDEVEHSATMKKGFEEFEKHMVLKMNEERVRQNEEFYVKLSSPHTVELKRDDNQNDGRV